MGAQGGSATCSLLPGLGMLRCGHPYPPAVTAQQPDPGTPRKACRAASPEAPPLPSSQVRGLGSAHSPGLSPDLPPCVCLRDTVGLGALPAHLPGASAEVRPLRALAVGAQSLLRPSATPSFPPRQPVGGLPSGPGDVPPQDPPPSRGWDTRPQHTLPPQPTHPCLSAAGASKYSKVMLTF